MRLDNKVALVTGSSRGIGRKIALAMAAEGADVVINYSRSKNAAKEAAKEVEALGRKAVAMQASVTSRPDVEKLVRAAVDELGGLDILVNNAGGFPIKPFAMVTDEEWAKVINLDLTSVFLCSQVAMAEMRQRRKGTIVNMASVSGAGGRIEHGAVFGCQGRGDRLFQGPGPGGGPNGHHGERHCAGDH